MQKLRKFSLNEYSPYLLRFFASVLLSSVFTLVLHWGRLDFKTLDFARNTSLVSFLLYTLISYELLTIFAISLTYRLFDKYVLAYAAILYLFLIIVADTSFNFSLGILMLLLIIAFLAAPSVRAIHADRQSRPYTVVLFSLLAPLLLLIFFRLFSAPQVTALFTQRNAGINLAAQLILILFFGGAIGVLIHEWKIGLGPLRRSNSTIALVCLAGCLHLLFVGGILVLRYLTLRTPTYDFGLFAQMFAYMKETGLPMTTLERNRLLTHFAVHISPIFYLMLPFYLIWPDPVVLQIMQPLIVASGLVPLLLLARHFRLARGWQIIFAFIYAFHPGLIGSSLYDLHENCFLAPLLLWVLYWLERKNWIGIIAFSLLVLAIKEDSALYLATIGLYFLFDRSRRKFGLVLLPLALVYFAVALNILATFGTGPMVGRFNNLIADPELGLLSIPITIMKNPGYLLSEVFSEEKIIYMLKMLLPVGFLPLLNRRLSTWVLLIPFVVMNLISYYTYQYTLRFQYHYGSAVLLIYIMLIQVAGTCQTRTLPGISTGREIRSFPGRRVLNTAVGIGLTASILFGGFLILDSARYLEIYREKRQQTMQIKSALDTIPASSSVQASTLLTAYLSRNLILYDLEYNQREENPHITEYVAIDLRRLTGADYQGYIDDFRLKGYEETLFHEDLVLILRRDQ